MLTAKVIKTNRGWLPVGIALLLSFACRLNAPVKDRLWSLVSYCNTSVPPDCFEHGELWKVSVCNTISFDRGDHQLTAKPVAKTEMLCLKSSDAKPHDRAYDSIMSIFAGLR